MPVNRVAFGILACFACLASMPPPKAWALESPAAELQAFCETTTEVKNQEQVVCHVRSVSGATPHQLRVALQDRTIDAQLEDYNWSVHRSALYFVVQQAKLNDIHRAQLTAFLDDAAFPRGKQTLGIGVSGTTLNELAPLASYRKELEAAVAQVATLARNPEANANLSGLGAAIDKVAAAPADRRAIILLSSASLSDGGVDIAALVKHASDAKVPIYVVMFGPQGTQPSSALTRLARETAGKIIDLTNASHSQIRDAAATLFRPLENGFVATIDANQLPPSSDLLFTATLEHETTVSAPPQHIERRTETPWPLKLKQLVRDNPTTIIGGIGTGAALYLLFHLFGTLRDWLGAHIRKRRAMSAGVILTRVDDGVSEPDNQTAGTTSPNFRTQRRNLPAVDAPSQRALLPPPRDPTESNTLVARPPTQHAFQPGPILATLQFVDSAATDLPLYLGVNRIGRAPENEVRLTDLTVHRHHAVLEARAAGSPNGSFVIRDLGTRNGVVINGALHREANLTHGDIVELGKIRLRFLDVSAQTSAKKARA